MPLAEALPQFDPYLSFQASTDGLSERSRAMAGQLDKRLLPIAGAAIPVAAHQEHEDIYDTLAVYAAQKVESQEFGVMLGVNWPEAWSTSEVEQTWHQIHRAQADFPQLNIQALDQGEYPPDTTIGEMRRDLWDALVITANAQEVPDMLVFNHDADLKGFVSPNYIRAFINHFHKPHASWPLASRVSNHRYPDLPELNKLMFFWDCLHNWTNAYYDAAIAIPLTYYCDKNGFNTTVNKAEMQRLIRGDPVTVVPHARLITSGRHLASQLLHRSPGSFSDWSIHQSEAYRSEHFTDIGASRRKIMGSVLLQTAYNTLYSRFYRQLHEHQSEQVIDTEVARIRRLASLAFSLSGCDLFLQLPWQASDDAIKDFRRGW